MSASDSYTDERLPDSPKGDSNAVRMVNAETDMPFDNKEVITSLLAN